MMFVTPEDMDRHRAIHEVAAHDIVSLFDDLKKEHLETLAFILDGIAMGDSPVRTASYMSGRISSVLQARFNVCPACGKDHDKDLEALSTEEPKCPSCGSTNPALHPATQADGGEVTLCSDDFHVKIVDVPEHILARRRTEGIPEPGYTEIGTTLPLADWEQKQMDEYDLDDLREETTNRLMGFICKNCTMRYNTIKDRASEPKGVAGCSGCQHKGAWG